MGKEARAFLQYKEKIHNREQHLMDSAQSFITDTCGGDSAVFSQQVARMDASTGEALDELLSLFDGVRILFKKDPDAYRECYDEMKTALNIVAEEQDAAGNEGHIQNAYEYLGLSSLEELQQRWDEFVDEHIAARSQAEKQKMETRIISFLTEIEELLAEELGDEAGLLALQKDITQYARFQVNVRAGVMRIPST